MTAKVISLEAYRKQREACENAHRASCEVEWEASHVEMRRAFPDLAADYPCDCASCRKAGIANG